MLAMIEINLLPAQYKAVERTAPAVLLTLLGGGILLALSLGGYFFAANSARARVEEKGEYQARLDKARKEAEEVRLIEKRIEEAQGRIDTVLAISQTKVYWAMKIEQLLTIIPSYVWIDALYVREPPDKKGQPGQPIRLELECHARGSSGRVPEFMQVLRSNTNFFHHFSDPDAIKVEERHINREPVQAFTLVLPLKKDFYAPDLGMAAAAAAGR